MSSPTERPVPDDSAPDQGSADVAKSTIGTGAGGVGPAHQAPYSTERHGMFGVSGSGDTSGFGGLVREPWTPPPAERPYGSYFDEIVDALYEAYPQAADAIEKVVVDRDELTLHIVREHLARVAQVLRDDPNLRFELCSSVSGVDYLGAVNRLHSVVQLTSMTYRRRVRLETAVSVDDPHLPSITPLYPTADWQERETFDMFGIVYDGHPGLTRILMPDDWDGHPQRKDYPLGGIPVQYKGATIPPPDERRAYK
ncbi:MAG: NADH-quinone oxidoreductase subunit C [Jatrophihabitans endophyticus]|nr:NADH-quinone oxidoreductase subunit C [Jatrophihabitans endophyticus]MBE7190147.1 NADH-quinone oxidoreductase subunit C [Jatrophihabitans endophyticus]